jgi:hypothetical protein
VSLLVFDVDPVRQQDLAPEDYRLPNLKARETFASQTISPPASTMHTLVSSSDTSNPA